MTGPLERQVAEVDRALRLAHAGGLELVGARRVRFTGMCAGCLTQPLCLAATVRPALGDDVEVDGMRISPAAAARLERLLGLS